MQRQQNANSLESRKVPLTSRIPVLTTQGDPDSVPVGSEGSEESPRIGDAEDHAADVQADAGPPAELPPPPPPHGAEPQALGDRRRRMRQSDGDPTNFSWGDFDFTWKAPKGGAQPAWQVLCRVHASASDPIACRRTRSLLVNNPDPQSEDSEFVVRRLKRWAIAAHPGYCESPVESAEEHKGLARDFGYADDYADEDLDRAREELEELLAARP